MILDITALKQADTFPIINMLSLTCLSVNTPVSYLIPVTLVSVTP